MEQLSLFDFLFEEEKKSEIVFTESTQECLIIIMSQAIIDVYTKVGEQHETN